MSITKKTKLRATLLVSTVMAGVFVLPEAGYGMQHLRKKQEQEQQEKVALQARVHAGGTHQTALRDPGAALAAAGPGSITAAVTAASGDGGSAATGMPFATNADKIAIIRAVEGGGAGDNAHKAAIRTALGLDPAAPAGDVTAFADAANRQILAPKAVTRAAKIVNLRAHQTALRDPGAALAAAGPGSITAAVTSASGDGGSAATGMPFATNADKIAIIRAVEGGGAGDNAHKAAIRTALGLDPAAPAGDVTAFADAANRQILAPKAVTRAAKIVNLRAHQTALRDPGAALAAAGPGSITAAVTAASGDGGSAATGMPFATNADKIAIIRAVEGGGAGDNAHKAAIRTALGLDPAAPAGDVTAFADAANRQILAPKAVTRAAKIVNLRAHQTALRDPGAALAAAGPGSITAAVTAASGDGGSAATGMPFATNADKIAIIRAVEGGGAGDNAHKAAIRTALGLDPAAPAGDVTAFVEAARTQNILQTIHNRLAAGGVDNIRQHITAPGGAGAGGQLGAAAFTGPNPDNREILMVFSQQLSATVDEAASNGVHPNVGQINAWLHQFGM